MRALHFCFWLHHPYELLGEGKWERGYFGGEQEFRRLDQRDYQPLLALLERNAQRYAKMRVSLVMSGVWLEQAERWDMDMVDRLKKLVKGGQVELVVTPYDYAMAAFYDLEELAKQVERMQEKYEQVFGIKSSALALPKLCYHNRIARWAEKAGFRVILAGDARGSLDWRSSNRIYAAKGCEKLAVLFENYELTEMIRQAKAGATEEVAEVVEMEQLDPDLAETKLSSAADFVQAMQAGGETAATERKKVHKRKVFSAKNFQKQLDLALLRGNIVNISLDAEVFGNWREQGVIGFFDELMKIWCEKPGSYLAGVRELAQLEPRAEVSIKKTASSEGEAEKDYQIPGWWTTEEDERSVALYGLRERILRSEDEDLYRDFTRLTALEYAQGGEQYEEVYGDLRKKVDKVVAELNDAEKLAARKMAESTKVKIKFDHTAKKQRARQEELYWQMRAATGDLDDSADDMDDVEATIQVLAQRMKQANEKDERDLSELMEAEVVMDENMGFEAADFDMEEEATFDGEPEADAEMTADGEMTPEEPVSEKATPKDAKKGAKKSTRKRKTKKIVVD